MPVIYGRREKMKNCKQTQLKKVGLEYFEWYTLLLSYNTPKKMDTFFCGRKHFWHVTYLLHAISQLFYIFILKWRLRYKPDLNIGQKKKKKRPDYSNNNFPPKSSWFWDQFFGDSFNTPQSVNIQEHGADYQVWEAAKKLTFLWRHYIID